MMGRHLGIDFSWILLGLGGQVGAKLGSKIDKKSIQKGIEKQMPKRRRLGGVLEASWAVLEASWAVLEGSWAARIEKMRRPGGCAWGCLKAKLGLFCPFVQNTLLAALHGRGRRIANACGDHRRPLIF